MPTIRDIPQNIESKGYVLSKEQIKEEIRKCGRSPKYFIQNYCKIAHPIEGLLDFNLYPFQSQTLEEFQKHRFNVILKSRQLGISTLLAGYCAWMLNFFRHKNILTLATKEKTAANLVKKVRIMMRNIPLWLQINKVVEDNKTLFSLSNGSQILALPTSSDTGRSEATSLLILDEAAIIENLEEIWSAVYPTLATGGSCIAASTPKGAGGWFYKMFIGAQTEENDFFPITLPYDVHPEHDEEWLKNETKNMDRRLIAQEYLCSFNASGDTVIHPDDLERLELSVVEPHSKIGFDRNLWIWKEPEVNSSYVLIADTARGDGEDYSAFIIFKIENMEQVAEYRGKMTPDAYANFIFQVATDYNKCMIVAENNTVGYMVIDYLISLNYTNLYYSVKSTHDYIDPIMADQISNSVAGFSTTPKTRPLVIAKMEEFVRNKIIILYSSRLLSEFKTFIWYNGRPQAQKGYNDDLIMTCAIGCWIRDTALIENKREIEFKKALLSSVYRTNRYIDTSISGMNKVQIRDEITKLTPEEEAKIKEMKGLLSIYRG